MVGILEEKQQKKGISFDFTSKDFCSCFLCFAHFLFLFALSSLTICRFFNT